MTGGGGGVSDFVTLFIKIFKFSGDQKWSFLALSNIQTTHYEISITVTYVNKSFVFQKKNQKFIQTHESLVSINSFEKYPL